MTQRHDTEVIGTSHETVTMLADHARGVLTVWSEPEPSRTDWREALRIIESLAGHHAYYASCRTEGSLDVFEVPMLPGVSASRDDCNVVSSNT